MCNGFNSSIWHALLIVMPLGVIAYFAALLTLKGNYYFFDPKHNTDPRLREKAGDFEPHARRYQDLAKLLITLSGAAIAFFIGIVANSKPPLTSFDQRIEAVAPIAVGFFASTIASMVFFMVLETLFYEEYCHSAEHNTYTRRKYALVTGLGWTGLLSFVFGFIWLARNLFHP